MKKHLYTLLIAYFLVAQTLAQHTHVMPNEMATHTLAKQFMSTMNEYKLNLFKQYKFSASNEKIFATKHNEQLSGEQKMVVAQAFHELNASAYLAKKEIELKQNVSNLVRTFNPTIPVISKASISARGVSNGNTTNAISCTACVTNPGFESIGVSDWEGQFGNGGSYTVGYDMGPDNEINTAPKTHHITTAGNDEVGGFPRLCNLIPDNHHSFRLGNKVNGYSNERMTYQFVVDSLKPYFTYYYAVVIEDAGHGTADQPYFTVAMKDASSNPIACASYLVAGSTTGVVGGFTNVGSIAYKSWSPITIPLVGYIGQCVSITFETRDCTFGGHWGYAYIDADCTAPEIVSPPSICNNGKSKVILHAPLGAGSYTWSGPKIQGANNADSVAVVGSGQYTCVMTTAITSGGSPCTYSVTRTVLPAPTPIAQFTNNTPCSGETVQFTNTTTPSGIWTSYLWDFNNDATVDATTLNTEATFFNATPNTISVPVRLQLKTDYCNADTVINIIVNPKPIADAGIDQAICTGSSFTVSCTPTVSYEWYAGLNVFSNTVSTNQTYTTTPIYSNDYTVIAINQYSCKDTDDVRITLNRVPNPDFAAQDVCFPDSTHFTSLSSNTGAGDTYTWVFENNKTGNGNIAAYNYATCGAKPVTLIISTTDNCANTITKNVNVLCKPVASFTTNNVCLYDSATFTNSSIGNTTIKKYQWDFEYGNNNLINPSYVAFNDTLPNVSYKYFAEGNKNVVLIVTNTDGCKDSVLKTFTVYATPTATFNADNVCLNTSSLFISTSTVNAPDGIAQYQWDYNNDGVTDQTSALNTQNYTYPAVYKNDALLIVTTTNGCKDTAVFPIEIYPLPVAQFYAQNKCNDSTVTFINNSTVSYGSIKTSTWSYTFTDGAISNSTVSTSFVFPQEDYYPVLLTATSNFGCVDTQMQVITIYPNPIPEFSSNQKGCTPFCTTEINSSTISTTPVASTIDKYMWSYGTGDTSTERVPMYCYPNITDYTPKKYTVTLKVESNYGCINSIIKTDYIEVYPKPKANFRATPTTYTISKDLVQITDSSIIASNIVWDYDVNYSPVTFENSKYKTLNYKDSGTYIITQYVESSFGCKDTAYRTIVVKPNYNLFIPNAFTPNDDGTNDMFAPKFFGMAKLDLMIFNRWGDLIARVDETNKQGWNGLDDRTQEKCKSDVYLWKVKYTTLVGTTEEANGKVTLLR
ncbi:MAG: gliding motility-associated C-terminal domain-containing protein [Bacteroidia bacterium]|nr:gliding motility-associated C-terminal domain-containing protein [Bacteroidia bacterium]